MNKKPLNRESLKAVFSDGNRPDANSFGSLIDSMVNKVEDGISKNAKDGLMLAPELSESERLISFYQKINNETPDWSIELAQDGLEGLGIVENISQKEKHYRLFFEKNGNVGVGTTAPKTNLEVKGTLGIESKVGTYKMGMVPADGTWHDIITDLDHCNAFEIVAKVGKKKAGKYALLHAHALSTYGKSRSRISCTQAHYGWWWNKIALRWVGSTFDYKLQMKTRTDYGAGLNIRFHISKLWDNNMMSLFNSDDE
ncbi:hypothetical protein [Ascidiimonas sp. W6]|uniref:hypothetical protein n=1 Tax=Ascidiimonas meishanensis TaxID=3128903 RepID=UPI0030EF7536